jgi:hypothetical protein
VRIGDERANLFKVRQRPGRNAYRLAGIVDMQFWIHDQVSLYLLFIA